MPSDPVVGGKINDVQILEPILHRIFQVNVRYLMHTKHRLAETERTKMDQTKAYMQELLMLRERDRRGSATIVRQVVAPQKKQKQQPTGRFDPFANIAR